MTTLLDELSRRPYLVRAMNEWMCDNGQTPHIVVDARCKGVSVPLSHVNNDRIILNIGHSATHGLLLDNDAVSFHARFDGVEHRIVVPVAAIMGIYARESGQGMVFVPDEIAPPPDGTTDGSPGSGPEKTSGPRSHLKIVK